MAQYLVKKGIAFIKLSNPPVNSLSKVSVTMDVAVLNTENFSVILLLYCRMFVLAS